MNPLNIVFAGTPDFAIPCLQALAASEHDLKAVYTQPDRPAGRGRKLCASPVKQWAIENNLPVYQPDNFKSQAAVDELAALSPDVMVVIAYGLILPQKVLSIPTKGCINVHASLLPRWRGASPIQQAILHGDAETGVTIMQMDAGMDTGDMLKTAVYPIAKNETGGSLHDKLAEIAAKPLLEVLNNLSKYQQASVAQTDEFATYAPKILKQDALIQWAKPAIEIECLIRAYNPWPIAYTHFENQPFKIYEAQILAEPNTRSPGVVIDLTREGLKVATLDNPLLITKIQFPGGKPMSVADWLNAGKSWLTPGSQLS